MSSPAGKGVRWSSGKGVLLRHRAGGGGRGGLDCGALAGGWNQRSTLPPPQNPHPALPQGVEVCKFAFAPHRRPALGLYRGARNLPRQLPDAVQVWCLPLSEGHHTWQPLRKGQAPHLHSSWELSRLATHHTSSGVSWLRTCGNDKGSRGRQSGRQQAGQHAPPRGNGGAGASDQATMGSSAWPQGAGIIPPGCGQPPSSHGCPSPCGLHHHIAHQTRAPCRPGCGARGRARRGEGLPSWAAGGRWAGGGAAGQWAGARCRVAT